MEGNPVGGKPGRRATRLEGNPVGGQPGWRATRVGGQPGVCDRRVPQPQKAANEKSVSSSSGQSPQVQEQGWKLQSTKKKQIEKAAEV